MSYQLLPIRDGDDAPLPHPVSTMPGPPSSSSLPYSRRFRIFAFLGTAAATGILFHLLLLGFGRTTGSDGGLVEAANDWWKSSHDEPAGPPVSSGGACPVPEKSNEDHGYTRPGLGQYVDVQEDEWTMERLKTMVAGTKGYYARDYSLGLGWNNMRYIIETSLLHAQLLNRTLILPSFVYARACEWNVTVCAQYADMINRGDAIGSDEWRKLPMDAQMGWRIPIEIMLDLRHLRKKVPVVTVGDFLEIQGLSRGLEWSNGAWQREGYHSGPKRPLLAVIPNGEYDPRGVVRVDKIPPAPKDYMPGGQIHKAVMEAMGDNVVLSLTEAEKAIHKTGLFGRDDAEKSQEALERLVERNGFTVLHTFEGALGMDYTKSVTDPVKQIAPRSVLKGLIDDYDSINEEVLLLEGETHLYRKPGSLRFATLDARMSFADLVLHWAIHIPPVEVLSDRIAQRMLKLNDGRMWMAGHMRRGDFTRLGWAMENTIENHFGRIKTRLQKGAQQLRVLWRAKGPPKTSDVPFVKPDVSFANASPPRDGDKFYLATDERSPEGLKYCRDNGAVLIMDLLEPEDRRFIGWPLLFTDVLALLEQSVMSHAAYFYAHAMSSVAGGVLNQRAARGMDPRTALVD